MNADEASVEREPLRLDQYLKILGVVGTGGHAKFLIQNGEVLVNGEVETRRRCKLFIGDVVEVGGQQFLVDETVTFDS